MNQRWGLPSADKNPAVEIFLGPSYGVVGILYFFLFVVCYSADLASWYPQELLFVAAALFVLSTFFAISYLFFFVPNFSLALVLLIPYLVFIGGRIIVLLITGDVTVFEYSYFTDYQPVTEEVVKLTIQATIGFLGIFLGYLAGLGWFRSGKLASAHPINWDPAPWAMRFLWAGLPILLWELLGKFILVRSEGYAAFYLDQVTTYSGSFLSFSLTLLTLALCFSFAGDNRFVRRLAVISYACVYLLLGVIGQRGPVFSLLILLSALAFEGRGNRQKMVYSLIAIAGVLALMQLFSLVTLRDYSLEPRYGNSLLDFLYEQGGTLSIYGMSLGLDEYPWSAYVQNFLPGFAVFANLLGYPMSANELNFGAYLSEILNPQLYGLGQGVGWSLLGDAFQFFGILYPAFLLVLGFFLAYVDVRRKRDKFFLGIWILLLAKISFLPRASVGLILLPLVYYAAFWLLIALSSKYKSRTTNRVLLKV